MLSLVIPVYNEEESLTQLFAEISEVAAAEKLDVEILFIDDGSRDGSWKTIKRLASQDARVRGVRFRRNFGKAAALTAGFAEATGEAIMTLDADLQDDPHEIPRFLAKLDKRYDVVSGWKQERHDPWHKVYPSRVFNWLVSALTGVRLHDHNCGMKAYRREVCGEIQLYGELHRFVPVLADARGFRVGELVIHHRPRAFGQSKYGVSRFIKGLLDLITVKFLTGFGQRPQHVFGSIGLGLFSIGILGLVWLTTLWVVSRLIPGVEHVQLHQRPALMYALGAMMLGGQFLSIGIIGELFIAYHAPHLRAYSISAHVGLPPREIDTSEDASQDEPHS
jgi:dolichol-phosphate mannosyltransferase